MFLKIKNEHVQCVLRLETLSSLRMA